MYICINKVYVIVMDGYDYVWGTDWGLAQICKKKTCNKIAGM